MTTKITDVLMPLEDEVLFSWIVRMLKHYSDGTLQDWQYIILENLFGEETQKKPGLYFHRGLDYFSSNCGLSSSDYFSSEERMIDTLTILPFYRLFLDERSKQLLADKIKSNKSTANFTKSLMRELGMVTVNRSPMDYNHIKFCPECLKESGTVYIKREHQILGNFFCHKHGYALKYVPYKRTSLRDSDFQKKINDEDYFEYTLLPQEEDMAKSLTTLIHEIYCNGLKEDILVIRKKLLHRMIELGHITKKGKFPEVWKFCKGLNVDFLYGNKHFSDEVIKVLAGPKYHPNPIIYIALIINLFGSLEGCYSYSSPVFEVSNIEWLVPEGIYPSSQDRSTPKWEIRG